MKKLFLVALIAALTLCGCSIAKGQARALQYNPLPEAKAGAGLGVNTHAEVSKNGAALMQAAGITYVRVDFDWDMIEKSPGVYDWSRTDQIVQMYKGTGIKIIGILVGNSRAYFPDTYNKTVLGLVPGTPQYRAFLRFVQAVVTKYRGIGTLWELWNEPNIVQFWGPAPNVDQYMTLSHDVRRVFNYISVKEVLVGGALSDNDGFLDFATGCVKRGCKADWDAISLHPYAIFPEEARVKWRALRAIVGSPYPMIATEQGYGWKNFAPWGWVGTDWGMYKDIPVTDESSLRRKVMECNLAVYKINVQEGIPITVFYDWPSTSDDMGFVKPYAWSADPLSTLIVVPTPTYDVLREFYQNLVDWRLAKPAPVPLAPAPITALAGN